VTDSTYKLAGLVLGLVNASALDDTLDALRAGRLTQRSGAATLGSVASGRIGVTKLLQELIGLWQSEHVAVEGAYFAALLEAIADGAWAERTASPTTEVVWTGPKVEGSYLRATRQVVQDIIQGAERELLVVGYWIAGSGDHKGIINDVVEQIADAVKRGVTVTMVLDQRDKPYGKNNREILLDLWPHDIEPPVILTWDIPEGEKHLKLHAKVLVADRRDALVTSANLTMYALDRNMEMGVRVSGNAGERIAHHFDQLRQQEILATFEP